MQTSDNQWRQKLTAEQYRVLREKGTEAPFSSPLEFTTDKGTYSCAACGQELFDSETKFDAHCGWPSFYDAKPGAVIFGKDDSLGVERTEVTCSNCGGHLGHVFKGEKFATPTDQRYCINGVSLTFKP